MNLSNWDAREPAVMLLQSVDGGRTIGDLGYCSPECAVRLAGEAEMLLITHDQVPAPQFLFSQLRQGIATTFSHLW